MVDEALEFYLPPAETHPTTIHQGMRYAVFNGGKRLRPILVLEGAKVAKGDAIKAMPFACAVEMIHCYSLVHDDLPAMDDDDFRRGKPTCHKVFGEAMAILIGDALLTRAFEVMASVEPGAGMEVVNIQRAMLEVAKGAGSRGMIAGQVIDLESEGKKISYERLKDMHRRKTGALIRASLKAGAMLFGAGERELKALEEFAEQFGLAFQITDDILDVEGDEAEMGKTRGSDAKHQKATFVSLFGLKEARRLAEERVDMALASLSVFGPEADFLRELACYIVSRRS